MASEISTGDQINTNNYKSHHYRNLQTFCVRNFHVTVFFVSMHATYSPYIVFITSKKVSRAIFRHFVNFFSEIFTNYCTLHLTDTIQLDQDALLDV